MKLVDNTWYCSLIYCCLSIVGCVPMVLGELVICASASYMIWC